MKNFEFCYWLQGYFELRRETDDLTEAQIAVIQKHLGLVEKVEGFPAWISVALEIGCRTAIIKDKLSKTFKHDIDPTYDISDNSHGPGRPRC